MARQTTGRRPPLLGERDMVPDRDDIDGPNRLGAMRDGADACARRRHDLVGACDLRRRKHDVEDLAVGPEGHDDLFAPPPRRERRSWHGRG